MPAGLTLNPTSGEISGVLAATDAGTFTVTLSATEAGNTGTATLTLTIASAGLPVITSPALVYATLGQPLAPFYLTATNGPTSFTAPALPAGLSLNTTTGLISGTPTGTTTGTPGIVVAAANSLGTGPSSTLVIVLQATGSTVTATLQTGVSPTTSYMETSAGIAIDTNPNNLGIGNSQYSELTVGKSATQSNRTLLDFDLSPIPPGATITGASLTLQGTSTAAFPVELHLGTPFEAGYACWTQNSSYSATLLSTLNVTAGSGAATWPTSPSFVSAVQNALSNNYGSLVLMLVSPIAESSTTTEDVTFSDETVSPPSSRPALTITYTTSAPPILSGNTTLSGAPGSSFNYQVTGLNVGTNPNYQLTGAPTGTLVINSSTGLITGTMPPDGTYQVTVSATNANGTGTTTFTINVGDISVVTSGSLSGTANSPMTASYPISATNLPTSYDVFNLPPGLNFNSQTGVISGTPSADSAGTYDTTLSATNAYGTGTASLTFTIAGIAPVITTPMTALAATQNDSCTYAVSCHGSPTSFSLSGFASSLNLSIDSTGNITGTPTASPGSYTGYVTATNSIGSNTAALTVTVASPALPVIAPQSASAVLGQSFTYTVQATVPVAANASPVSSTFTASTLPFGLTMSSSGVISGTPMGTLSQATSYPITITSGSGTGTFTLTVFPSGPGIKGPFAVYAQVGQKFSYDIQPVVSSGGVTTSAVGLPSFLSYVNEAISGTLTTPGTWNITLTATNSSNITSTFTLILIVGQTVNAQVGVPFTYQIVDNSNPINFHAPNLPTWLTLSSTGLLSGTPVAADSIPINVTVTDAVGNVSGYSYSLLLVVAPRAGDIPMSFQQGVNPAGYSVPSVTIANDTLNPATANQTFNTGTVLTVGQTSATASSRALLAFDLSALPANATITSATLVVNTNTSSGNSSGVPFAVEIHKSSTPFLATTANWADNNLYGGNILGSLVFDPTASSGLNTFPVTALLTQTAQQAYSTNGKLYLTLVAPSVEGQATPDYIGFTTNAATPSQNPKLIVTYTTGAPGVPAITSPTTVTGTINVPLSYTITATNNPQSYSATGLPTGLAINTTTGTISGTVTTASSTVATVSAANLTGTGNQTVTFNIDNVTPTNPSVPSDSLAVLSLIGGQGQSGPAGQTLPQPFVVQATSPSGQQMSSLALNLTVTAGGGNVSSSPGGTFGSSLSVATNSAGQATIYLRPGNTGPENENEVSCVASASGAQTTVYLTALTSPTSIPTPTPAAGGGTPPSVDTTDPVSLATPVITIIPFPYSVNGVPVGDQSWYDYTTITIKWTASANATSYEVDKMDDTGVWKEFAIQSNTSITDQGLYSGVPYQYRVYAVAGSDRSQPGIMAYNVPLVAAILLMNVLDGEDGAYGEGVPVDGGWYEYPYLGYLYGAFNGGGLFAGSENIYFKFLFNPTRAASTFKGYYNITTMSWDGPDGWSNTPIDTIVGSFSSRPI